ncbi:MAG: rhomboid family intramembrane serine protease, partial [Pirellulaceae bacterium]
FRRAPDDPRYRDVEREADSIRRDETKRREQSHKNVVETRGKWGRGGARHRTLTLTLIGLCVVIGLVTNMGGNRSGTPMRKLLFVDVTRLKLLETFRMATWEDKAYEIRRGEVWRLFTPALVHYGPMHLAFNMIMFYQLGSLIEERRGAWRLALMIVAMAVISNVVQSLVPYSWDGSPIAAGFSGVVFGLFGYVWLKSIHAPELGMAISRNAVFILMLWLFLGISGVLGQLGLHVANWSHGIGFLVGAAIGYFPEAVKFIRAN